MNMDSLPNELLVLIADYSETLALRRLSKRWFFIMNEIFYSDVRDIMAVFRYDLKQDNELSRNLRIHLNCAKDAIQETNSLCIKWRILQYIYNRRKNRYELEYNFKITHEFSDLIKIMDECNSKNKKDV